MGGRSQIEEQFVPMHKYSYEEAVKEYEQELVTWLSEQKDWNNDIYTDHNGKKMSRKAAMKMFLSSIDANTKKYGFSEDYKIEEKQKFKTGYCSYEDIAGEIPRHPDPDKYMPSGEWYQLFENVSEGTPASPPFATKEELVGWLTNNLDYWGGKWTKEQAQAMIEHEYAPSMVMTGGKLYNSQESLLIK